MCLGICQEENGGIFGKSQFGPWDARIFEVEPALDEPPVSVQAVVFLDVVDDGPGKVDVVVAGTVVARVVRDERLAGVAGLVAEAGKL